MPALRVTLGIALLLLGLSALASGAMEDPAVEPLSSSQLQALISRLTADDEWQRETTLKQISPYIQQGNSEVLAQIIKLLNGDLIQRRIAIKILKTPISFPKGESFRRLMADAAISHLSDPDDYVRGAAVEVLEKYLARARAARLCLC